METFKAWYLSRTIWASLVTVLLGLAGALGLPVKDVDGAQLTDLLIQLVTVLSGLVAVFGRFFATSRIR